MLITKKLKYNKFNKITKKILKGGNDNISINEYVKTHIERRCNFFDKGNKYDINYIENNNLYNDNIYNKFNKIFETYERHKRVKLIYPEYHGHIDLNENSNISNNFKVPDNTILCFFTLLGNYGFEETNFKNTKSEYIKNIKKKEVENLLYSLASLTTIKEPNIELKYKEKMLYVNCYKNAIFYYPGQNIINTQITSTEKGKTLYRYIKFFNNHTISGRFSKKLETFNYKDNNKHIQLNDYILKNNKRTEKTIHIYLFNICRSFGQNDTPTINPKELFKYETYLLYVNIRLIELYRKRSHYNLKIEDNKINCSSMIPNYYNFIKKSNINVIKTTNLDMDYTYHIRGDMIIKIYNNFIQNIIKEEDLIYFIGLSLKKQFFILKKIVNSNISTDIIKNILLIILQKFELNDYHLFVGMEKFIVNNEKLLDNKKETFILNFNILSQTHYYYTYKEYIKQYIEFFFKYIDIDRVKQLKELLGGHIDDYEYIIYQDISKLSLFNPNKMEILKGVKKLVLNEHTTILEINELIDYFNRNQIEFFNLELIILININQSNFELLYDKFIINIKNKLRISLVKMSFETCNIKNTENIIYIDILQCYFNTLSIDINNKDLNINITKNTTINNLNIDNNNNLNLLIIDSIINVININTITTLEVKIQNTSIYTSLIFTNCKSIKLEIFGNDNCVFNLPDIKLNDESKLNIIVLKNINFLRSKTPIICDKLELMEYSDNFTINDISKKNLIEYKHLIISRCIPGLFIINDSPHLKTINIKNSAYTIQSFRQQYNINTSNVKIINN